MSTETVQLNWREFNSSRRWIKQLQKRNSDKEIPSKTLEAMNTWFPQFLRFHNKTPDDLIEESLTDSELVEERLDDFYRFKKEKIDRNSCITGIYGTIRGFYRHNKVNVQDVAAPKFSVRQVKKTDSNYPLFSITAIEEGGKKTKLMILNRELLREFYSHLNHRDQCIFLCLLSTGLDIQDFLKLTVGDVRTQFQNERIYLNGNRNKTFSEFSDFCTKEATSRIKEYVKKERVDAEDDEPVFVTTVGGRKREFTIIHKRVWSKSDPLPKAKRIAAGEISDAFRTAQRAMGIPMQKGKQSPLRPKRFKKVFRTACSNAGLDRDITKTFLGHSGDQSQNYEETSREILEYYYELVEPKISLFFDEEKELVSTNEMKLDMIKMQKEIDAMKESRARHEFASTND